MNRLYVLLDQSLDSIYACVQGGHAVAQWLLDHPKQSWNNSYLIYVRADVEYWKNKLDMKGYDFTVFNEPDLNNMSTALAIQCDGRMFKKLKLI